MVVRIESDAPAGVALAARLTRAWDAATERLAGHRQALVGRCGVRGSAFVAVLDVHADGGTVETVGDHVVVRGASAATLVVAAATDFRHARPLERACRDAERARARGFAALRADHVREHAQLFGRARFELHDPEDAAHAALPTDVRLEHVKLGRDRPSASRRCMPTSVATCCWAAAAQVAPRPTCRACGTTA